MLGPGLEEVLHHPVLDAMIAGIHQRTIERGGFPDLPGDALPKTAGSLLNGFVTILEQQFMQVDLDCADLSAVAT